MNKMSCLSLSVLFVCILTLGLVGPALAVTPDEEIITAIYKLKSIFDDQAMSKEDRMKQAQELVFEKLDLTKAASLILGKYLDKYQLRLSEFVDVFRRLLERTHLRRIDRVQRVEGVSLQGSKLYEGRAEVTLSFLLDGDGHKVRFYMHVVDGRWRVYNISVGWLDLVNSYRAQVNRMLGTRSLSFDEMLEEFGKKASDR